MAVNVDKLVADAKKKQEEGSKRAAAERAKAERGKADAKVIAESKSKLAYADTLKPRLKEYEARLKFFANRIARGDKLDSLEQNEFDRLVNDYNYLSNAVDKAIKDSYDVVANYNRKVADEAVKKAKANQRLLRLLPELQLEPLLQRQFKNQKFLVLPVQLSNLQKKSQA